MPYPAHTGWLKTHDMCATRFSAGRRNGFLRFGVPMHRVTSLRAMLVLAGAIILPASAFCAPATESAAPQVQHAAPLPPSASTAQPQKPAEHKKLRPEDRIAQLADQLAAAKTPEEAHALEGMLETMRAARLSPTTHLLLRRAEKDMADNKPDNAVDDMTDALALQPDSAILWRSRAQMRLVAGDLNGAVTDLGSALQRDPRDSQSWSLLATVEEHRTDGPAALKAWQKVMELNPMTDRNHKRLDALHIKAFGQPT